VISTGACAVKTLTDDTQETSFSTMTVFLLSLLCLGRRNMTVTPTPSPVWWFFSN